MLSRQLYCFASLLVLLTVLSSSASEVDCDAEPAGALQRAIDAAPVNETILMNGTCKEDVLFPEGKDRITIDGSGKATLVGARRENGVVKIRGRGVVVKGFRITGNASESGVMVVEGGFAAFIDGNIIEQSQIGINVAQAATAIVVNNVIQNNPGVGISAATNAILFVGVRLSTDIKASPNIIQNNGSIGIRVGRSTAARIVGNLIAGNGSDGVLVNRVSQADISDNQIDGNRGDGIHIFGGSGGNLGETRGDTIHTRPNWTTVDNSGFGVRCEIGGYASGRLGTLSGSAGAKNISQGCVDSVL